MFNPIFSFLLFRYCSDYKNVNGGYKDSFFKFSVTKAVNTHVCCDSGDICLAH